MQGRKRQMTMRITPSRLKEGLRRARLDLRRRFVTGVVSGALFELASFGVKQAWACLFGGLMLALLLATWLFYPQDTGLARYDFLFLAAAGIQMMLLLSGLETWEEVRVISVFHLVGTVMEFFKTAHGSWIYPEDSLLRLAGVPLFSGFMYACVGSYLARIWRILEFRFRRFPPLWLQAMLAAAIYINFFSHHWTADFRLVLFLAVVVVYLPARVQFRPDADWREMPLLIGFFLVAVFIWLAENIATFAGAWHYPGQENGWQMVSLSKLGSWYLLMIISFVLVATIHQGREGGAIDDTETSGRQSR